MITVQQVMLAMEESVLDCFTEVYLFGSALDTGSPNDIDIVLVYPEGKEIWQVQDERANLIEMLSQVFEGIGIDCTTLSKAELEATRFLERITYETIKGC